MEKQIASLLKEFDRSQDRRRVRARRSVDLPVELLLNPALPPSCGRVYGALKFLQTGESSVRVSHRQLKELTGLSQHTITKALKQMRTAGWLVITNYSGGLNVYDFSTPRADGADD